ncbi:MAG: permease [Pseudomonadota bacterium]
MLIPTIVMAVLAIALLIIGRVKGDGQHIEGMKFALKLTYQILPLLLFAMVVAGMATVLIPQELLARWVGAESGMRGIFLGTIAGALTPGGPFVSLPIVAGLFNTGAGAGTVVAFLTSWSIIAVSRLPLEFGILGWRLTVVRLLCSFFFPPIAGLLANIVAKGFKI